ncbi:MAG TPA: polyprenol phosphomannose-dependent alpha 1,6 mannosyltransferase MptB [Acidimicrobiales bacterium]|nr:polyprenol phosphomannose-dependent alpha 1,6 mannosyltransferase MptB [Acidimicrobiales bacterium]
MGEGPRRRRRFMELPALAQLAVVEGTSIVMLILGLVLLDDLAPAVFAVIKLGGVAALGLFALYGLSEAFAATRSTRLPPLPPGPLPPTTAIVPAYLPNEAPILVETIEHHLASGPPDLQLIVAYNTPTAMPIEQELAGLAERHPRLTVLRVENSQSKAANVNAALEIAEGDIIGVFDADHHPAPDCYERAWRWLADGADVVQGRCVVRRRPGERRSLVHVAVTAEFEEMYAVGHVGRTRLTGIGLFGGSNGFWRAEALKATRLDPTALTEDIDASVRLLRAGGRIATDPGIVSDELAPPSFPALCNQRLRWAQGWFQVARRHLGPILRNRDLPARKRVGVFWLWGWGALAPWLGMLSIPLTIHGWIHHDVFRYSQVIGYVLAFGTASFVIHVSVAYRRAVAGSRNPLIFATYIASNLVFYGYLRVALARLGQIHEFAGRSAWLVTPRTSGQATSETTPVPEAAPSAPAVRRVWAPPLPAPALATSGVPGASAAGDTASLALPARRPGTLGRLLATGWAMFRDMTAEAATYDGPGRDAAGRHGDDASAGTVATWGDVRALAGYLARPALLGLLATVAITYGASQLGSPFSLKVPGAWYFGIPSITTPPGRGALVALVTFYGGLVVLLRAWCDLLRLCSPARGGRSVPVVAVGMVAALWVLPLLVGPPLLSQDVYSYAAQAQMVGQGINPYVHGPEALGPNSPFYPLVDQVWRASPASYGPVFIQVAAGINGLVGHDPLATVVGLRLLSLLGVALMAFFLPMIARSLRRDPATVLVLAVLNPITLVHLVGGAHNDALMLGLLVAGLAMSLRGRPVWAVALCALAAGVRTPAIVGVIYVGWQWLGPNVTWRERIRPLTTACLGAAALLSLLSFATGLGWGWLGALGNDPAVRSAFAPTTALGMLAGGASDVLHLHVGVDGMLDVTRAMGLLVAAGAGVWLLVVSTRIGMIKAIGLTLLIAVLLRPVIEPWYLAWGIALLAPMATDRWSRFLVGVTVAGSFVELPGGRLLLHELATAPRWSALVSVAILTGLVMPPVLAAARRLRAAQLPPPGWPGAVQELVYEVAAAGRLEEATP